MRMKVLLMLWGVALVLASFSDTATSQTLLGTTFEGFGQTLGAEDPNACPDGFTIYTVTTADDKGTGSLRDAVSQDCRYVNFTFADDNNPDGVITLKSQLTLNHVGLTIDGFDSPLPVTIEKEEVVVLSYYSPDPNKGHDIVIRGIRFRQGENGKDNLRIWRNANRVVIDHCSFANAGDGLLDITEGAHNITISWNIFGETDADSHKAVLMQYQQWNVSVHHNLFYGNDTRHPYIGNAAREYSDGPLVKDIDDAIQADVRYNIIWGDTAANHGDHSDQPTWHIGTRVWTGATEEFKTTANVVSNLYHSERQPPDFINKRQNHVIVSNSTAHVADNVCNADCSGAQSPEYNTDHTVVTANDMSNASEFAHPAITGPAIGNTSDHLAEWQLILDEAGPQKAGFSPDAAEAKAINAVTLPASSIFCETWNDEGQWGCGGSPDCSENGICNAACGIGEDPDCTVPPDTTPPSPDPMTWGAPPAATGSTSISMTATTATDLNGVEYYFECTSVGCNNSGWQDSETYEDTGLTASTTYTYWVKARDKSPNQNETAWSSAESATTEWTELTYDDFESGWGNYSDGGDDCRRYTDSTHAHQGIAAINVQDNREVSSSFYYTNGIDVYTPGYTQIEVDFWFKAVDMESGEDFWVQYYDGSTWHTVATYVSGTDFNNSTFYNVEVYINEGSYNFPTNMKIRFMCDASHNGDDVYIDEVKVSAN